MTGRELRDLVVGGALLALVVAAFVTYDPPAEPSSSTSSAPAPAATSSAPGRVELVRRESFCAPDPLAGTVDVRLVLRNRTGRPARVDLFVKRSFHGGNDDGNALDLVRVTVPAHGRRGLGDTYPAHGQRLVRCQLWLSDRGPGGTPDGYRELPIEGAA